MPVGYVQPEEHAALSANAAARYLGAIERAAQQAGVAYEGITVVGEYPADVILEAAANRHCGVIAMASHGRRGLAHVLLGSETQKGLTRA